MAIEKCAVMISALFAALCSGFLVLETVTELQMSAWKTRDVHLPPLSSSAILVELTVAQSGTPVLLTASKNASPLAGFDKDGNLRIDALASDIVDFSYNSPTAFLALNVSDITAGGLLCVGVLLGRVPMGGVNMTLRVTSHSDDYSDGEICPYDCKQRGDCQAGQCVCTDSWVGEDCSQRAVSARVNERKDLIVAEKAYALVQVEYRKNQNLGITLNVVQGEVVLLVSYGISRALPSLEQNDVYYSLSNSSRNALYTRLEPTKAGPFQFLFALYNPDVMRGGQSLINIEFSQSTSEDATEWITIASCSASAMICCGCCVCWVRYILYRRKLMRRRHTARIYNSGSFSMVSDNDKLFPASLIKQEVDEKAECIICLETLKPEAGLTVLPCSHIFHSACIDAWFSKQSYCCVCKAEYSFYSSDIREVS